MKKIHLIVSGRVQGVGFRYFTLQVAKELNIKGWVRNLPDGNVEICAAGEESSLEIFIQKIKKGPPLSRVLNIEVTYDECENNDFKDFTIKYWNW